MNFLEKVVAKTRENLKEGYYDQRPKSDLEKSKKSLCAQLEKKFCLIAEIKPRSPQRGALYEGSVSELAKTYAEAGAKGVSVLCEPSFFEGKLENLTKAKASGVPVLAKDFVIGPRQLEAYAAHGADAVLLIQEIFDANLAEQGRDELIGKAKALGLEVVLESHSRKAFEKANKSNADVLGINNRDLETLAVDVSHAESIFKNQRSKRPVIAESGFSSREHLAAAKAAGFRGVLVGTALLASGNPLEKVRSLL